MSKYDTNYGSTDELFFNNILIYESISSITAPMLILVLIKNQESYVSISNT